jgi:hypothetical protein
LDAHHVRDCPTLLVVHCRLVPLLIDCWTITLPQSRVAKTGRLITVMTTGPADSPAWRMRRLAREDGARDDGRRGKAASDWEFSGSIDMLHGTANREPHVGPGGIVLQKQTLVSSHDEARN